MTDSLLVFTDGGARGNPGPAAIGIYIVDSTGKEVLKMGKRIGESTNNIAEYQAVINALEWINENFKENIRTINFFLDSSLVVNQLNGIFKVKKTHLRNLIVRVKELESFYQRKITYKHIPREKNKMADFLVNSAF